MIPQSWHKARRFGSHARLPPAVRTSVSWLKSLLCSGYFLLELWQAGQRQEELKGSVEHPWPKIRNMDPTPSSPVASRTAWQTRSFISPYKPSTTLSVGMLIRHYSRVHLLLCWMHSSLPALSSEPYLWISFCFQGTRNILLGSAPFWWLQACKLKLSTSPSITELISSRDRVSLQEGWFYLLI